MIRQTHRARSGRQFYLATAAVTTLLAWAGQADALPTGFQLTAGTVANPSITGPDMTITQSSSRAVINWGSFNIASGEQVTFAQPSKTSIAFNVVPASAGVTQINGQLSANGGIWLFSPAGILFGAGSAVTAGSFLASTGVFNSTSQNEAMSGANQIDIFPQATPGQGSITVQGATTEGCTTLPAATLDANAGFLLLHSPTIEQDGSVTASDAVVYNADEAVTVQFSPASDNSNIALVNEFSPSGTPSASHIDHTGTTTAGTWFEADAAEDVTTEPGYGGIINLGGVVVAHGMKSDPGNPNDSTAGYSVILDGDSAGDNTGPEVTTIDGSAGTINASAGIYANAGSISTGAWTNTGGAVQLSAGGAGPTGGIDIDPPLISTGSGLVSLIGTNVTLDSNVIAAGSVLVLSHDVTVGPNVTVQAGSSIADSSLIVKSTGDITADPSSQLFVGPALGTPTGALSVLAGATVGPQDSPFTSQTYPGTGGDLTLGTANGTAVTLAATPLNGVGGTLDVENSVTASGSVFMSAAQLTLGANAGIASGLSGSVIGAGEVTSNSATTDVVLQNAATPGAVPAGAGDIVLGAPVNFASADEALSLVAYHSIIVSGAINVSGSNSQVDLDTGFGGAGGDYSFVNGGSLSFTAGDDSQSLYINGNPYNLIYSQQDLLNINNNLGANYALAVPLDLAAGDPVTVFTGAPIAPTVYAPFTGTFTGLGNTISNLNIQEVTPIGQFAPAGDATNGALGLFGFVGSGGVVRDINLANAQVSGGDGIWAGALVGDLEGTVMNASSSGQVSVGSDTLTSTGESFDNFASAIAGGLVGYADGQIINAHSSATVTGGDAIAGGLVGLLDLTGSIANSSASGSVTVGDNTFSNPFAGGLVGEASGFFNNGPSLTITGSSATGAVAGGADSLVGGFVGDATETAISGSFATGAVQGGAGSAAGGFAGVIDEATVTTSNATGAVTQTLPGDDGDADIAGGFVGALTFGSSISQSYSTGPVQTVGGPDNGAYTLAGGFAGDVDTNSSISNSYSLSPASSTGAFADTGGFAGLVEDSSSIDHVYATGAVSGAGPVAGLVAVLGDSNEGAPVSSLSDSYWDTGTTGQSVGYHITPRAAIGDGQATATAVSGISGAGVYSAATYGNFDFTNTWVLVPGVTRPMLQSEYSTTITNAHQLQLMETNLTASYTLANNIDASGTSSAAGTAGGLWNPATGFSPVGGNGEANFTGTFNGQGYTISNLSIKFTTADLQTPFASLMTDGLAGLFGFVGPTGVLENVNLANAQVTAGDGMLAGALVGGSLGSVINASSSGAVSVGNEVNSGGGITADAGGLVGASAGTITNSTSSATVTGGDAFTGGLLGTLGNGGLVAYSSASGAVSVTSYPALGVDSPDAGGLIGEVDNSTVAGSFATGDVSGGAGAHIGGLLGSIDDGVATTSYATGNVLQTAGGVANSNAAAGGFAGSVTDGSQVTLSYASGDVSSVGAASGAFTRAGGFAGQVEGSGTSVSNDYALGAVNVAAGPAGGVNTSGGFAGAIDNDGSVDHVYATGAVSAASGDAVGGLVAQVGAGNGPTSQGGSITDSYWDEGTTGQTVGVNLAGTGTQANNTGIGGSTGRSPYTQATYTANLNPSDNFDFTNTWFMVEGSTRPILQSEYSTDITNAHQLQLMDMNLAANYTLGNDIDARGTSVAAGTAGGLWNPATGFSPIGASVNTPYTGVFDGQGHTISNLTIIDTVQNTQSLPSEQQTDGAVGLFGFATGTLQNVNLANVNVTGGDGMEVGALVGDMSGTVLNASSSGQVTVGALDSEEESDARGGGLIGELDGAGAVQNSSSSATVTGGSGALVGGLIGEAFGQSSDVNAVATGSFATGNVIGGAGSTAGGFVGFGSNFAVSYSYATGSVTQTSASDNWAGGFAGGLEFSTVNSSFASGPVSTVGTSNNPALAGGFVANLLSTTVNDAYAAGPVTVTGPDDIAGGFAGTVGLSSVVNNVYSIGAVDPESPGATKGGLFGTVSDAPQPDLAEGAEPSVTDAYWNSSTTGQTNAYGAVIGSPSIDVADVSADPYNPASYPGFNFGGAPGVAPVWSIPSEGFYPQLYGASHVLNVTAENTEITYGNYPVYTLDVTGLQGGDTIASAVHGFVVQPLDPQNDNAAPTVGFSGYYNVNNNDNAPYEINDPYDLSIAQTIVASGPTGAYRPIYNDNVNNVDGTLLVDPAPLTVAAVTDERPYDGATDSSGQPTVTGLVPGDGVNDNETDGPPTQSFGGADAGSQTLFVNPFTVADGNTFAQGANYTVTTQNAEGQIDPEDIEVGAVTDSKVYDGTINSSGTPVLVEGQLYGEDNLTNATQAFESKDVLGANQSTLTVTGYTLNLANPNDYNVSEATATAPGTITPAALLIDANSDSRVYNGTTSSTVAPTVDSSTPLFANDNVTDLAQAFASKDVLGTNGSTLNVTGYSVNDGNGGADYTVTLNSAQGTITPAALLIDATGDSKVYDGTTVSLAAPTIDSTTPVLGTDTVTGLTQAFASKDVLGTNGSTLNVTGYSVNDGNFGNDYTVTLAPAEGTITPVNITLSATSDTKVYDGTTNSGQAPTASQLFGSDSLLATQSFTSKDVLGVNESTLAINEGYSIDDGNGGADYNITKVYTAPGTITPASLLLDATGDSRVYNGTTSSTALPTIDSSTPLLNANDTVTGLTQAFASKDVLGTNGSTLNVTGYSVNDGNGGNDYTVTLAPAVGTITPASLLIDATADSKVYDGTTLSSAMPTIDSSTPVLGTDTVTGLTQAFASKDVLGTNGSTLNVTGYSVNDGNFGNDYTVTLAPASGTITPVNITLSATSDTKVYDGTTNSGQAPTASELFGSDSLVATQSFNSKDVLGTNESTLAINEGYSIDDGNGGADYNITKVFTAPGTITPLALTASLTGTVQKVYDGTTGATLTNANYSLPGVIGEDDVSLNDPTSGTYNNRNAGTGKTVTVTGLQLNGEDSEDYSVNTIASGPVGIITPAPLTLTAVTDTKTYDGGVTSAGAPTNSALIEGDSLSGLTQSFASKNVLGAGGSTLLVTGYTIDDGNDGNNYAVTLVSARGTINPAPLTIAAVADTKTYDGTTASSATPTVATLVGGDTISGLSETYGGKDAGAQTLTVGGYTINDGNDGNNYTVTTATAAGEIDPKTLDVTLIGNVQKAYDGNTNATLTTSNYSLVGVVSGDDVSLNDPTSGTYDTPAAGTHKLVTVGGLVLSGADEADYVVGATADGQVGTITAPPQTLQITVPTQDVTLLGFEQSATDAAGAVQTVITTTTTVVNVFPVGNDDNNGAQGDNLPITGAGNRDLWTTSDDSDQACPPGAATPCTPTGGSH